MKSKKLLILLVVLLSFGFISASTEYSPEKAKKVDRIIKRISKRQRQAVFLKKVTFTQNELNSYLNLIYNKKYAPEVKSIEIKLGKNNYAEGAMKIKLVGKKFEQVPSFLKDVDLEFSGKVECEKYRMRYLFEKIKVNGKEFSPALLDEAFGTAQAGRKIKKSMYDWFDLLPGIKNIVIDYKKITIYY